MGLVNDPIAVFVQWFMFAIIFGHIYDGYIDATRKGTSQRYIINTLGLWALIFVLYRLRDSPLILVLGVLWFIYAYFSSRSNSNRIENIRHDV